MNWEAYREEGEELRWEGRPAPRCYTFRRWPHSLFGLLLLPLTLVWAWGGGALAAERDSLWWGLLPWLFVGIALWLLVGHLFWSRLVWGGLFFAVSDRRLLVVSRWPRPRITTLPLARVRWFRVQPRGRHLASVLVLAEGETRPTALPCLEHPDPLISLLETAVHRPAETTT